MWRKLLCVLLAYAIFIAGCGGHNANPVDRHMLGDENKSCNALYTEVSNIDTEVALKNRSKTDRDIWNVIFFATGFLVIVPWFFIDAKGSQEVEIEALKARKNALQTMYADRSCGTPAEPVAVSHPSVAAPIATKVEPVENLGRYSGKREKCSTCGRKISKLEQHFMLDGKIVCKECYQSRTQIVKETPISESQKEQTQAEPNIYSKDDVKVANCDNCGRAIGKLEMPYPHDGHVVCYECFSRLKNQP